MNKIRFIGDRIKNENLNNDVARNLLDLISNLPSTSNLPDFKQEHVESM